MKDNRSKQLENKANEYLGIKKYKKPISYIQTQKNNAEYRKKLIKRATPSELKFKKFLDENNIRYMFQKGFLKPFHRIVDFYIPKYKLIIEIDGGYHINTKKKDDFKDRMWGRFKTLRILNNQVSDDSYIEIVKPYFK